MVEVRRRPLPRQELITILNFYQGSLTPEDENLRQPQIGGKIEALGKARLGGKEFPGQRAAAERSRGQGKSPAPPDL